MAEFTGERVIPGAVDTDLFNEHIARYAFAARLAHSKRVLDAGCGAGYGSAELARTAFEVLGIDRSTEAIDYARQHYRLANLRFAIAPCQALPLAAASVDLVVAFEVIEHLTGWHEFLKEARRVLAPGGQFVVSTPNKRYYAQTRKMAGPNPFHIHEFEFDEFRSELAAVFPGVQMFLQNHAAVMVFQPVEPNRAAEGRIDGVEAAPEESHFFVALCSMRPEISAPAFIYLPRSANVLRERERHIELLAAELNLKNEWLEKTADRNQQLQAELEERNRWATSLDRELAELRQELSREREESRAMGESYEEKIAELEEENRSKTRWALDTEERLGSELSAKRDELAQCVELLHSAERTVEERTAWARNLQADIERLEGQLSALRASRWVRLGRKLGLGPALPKP